MLLAIFALVGIRSGAAAETPAPAPQRDPHSYGRPDEAAVEHLSLDLTVDFEQHRLRGSAALRLANPKGATTGGGMFADSGAGIFHVCEGPATATVASASQSRVARSL